MVCAQEDCHGYEQKRTMKEFTMLLVQRPLLHVAFSIGKDAQQDGVCKSESVKYFTQRSVSWYAIVHV